VETPRILAGTNNALPDFFGFNHHCAGHDFQALPIGLFGAPNFQNTLTTSAPLAKICH
jgi:hypothetical protein